MDIGFVMLFAGFKSRCSLHDRLYKTDAKIPIPALLCIGEADEVIPIGQSEIMYSSSLL